MGEGKQECFAGKFLVGAFLQMGLACCIKWILNRAGIKMSGAVSLLLLAAGGLSTAAWGIIISIKSKKVCRIGQIVQDFFGSLWLCVLFHALLNMFSQALPSASLLQIMITAFVNISIILLWSRERINIERNV